jgi:hypothetical protein
MERRFDPAGTMFACWRVRILGTATSANGPHEKANTFVLVLSPNRPRLTCSWYFQYDCVSSWSMQLRTSVHQMILTLERAGVTCGLTAEEIALKLAIKATSVITHRKRAYARLGVSGHFDLLSLYHAST